MVHIPAFCDSCGAAFGSGIVVENCRNITFSGNRSGPCPRCGSMGSVIDGVFNVVREAAKEKDSTEQITEKINEQVPELSLITRYIPKNATELVAWLTFILIAMQTINQFSKDDSPDINIILNQSVEQSMQPQNYYPFNQQAIPPTRNSPCSCGSKKRYKHCCGLSI